MISSTGSGRDWPRNLDTPVNSPRLSFCGLLPLFFAIAVNRYVGSSSIDRGARKISRNWPPPGVNTKRREFFSRRFRFPAFFAGFYRLVAGPLKRKRVPLDSQFARMGPRKTHFWRKLSDSL